jgi:rhamnosyltransferase
VGLAQRSCPRCPSRGSIDSHVRIRAGCPAVKAYCVIVCYRPDVPRLLRLCEALRSEVSRVVLVDNSESPSLAAAQLPAGCDLVTLGFNSGIAHAQNVGVARAVAAAADVLVFFDQDSQIEPGFATTLIAPLKVGTPDIVAPQYYDDASNVELPSVRVSRYGWPRAASRGAPMDPYAVDIVISSGTAATKEVFDVVGGFDEGLFIDFVDTEWCLRCRSKNVPIHVVPSAMMRHRIGSKTIRLGFLTLYIHSPPRCYYQVRNTFHLFRKRHVPALFALREMASIFFNRSLLLLFVGDRVTYVKAYCRAVRDGAKGVVGRMPA